jgi:hypothetical protein
MKQTVTGRFKTWNDAQHAQDVLMQKGFAERDIELPVHAPGVLSGIERLVTSFFTTDPLARGTYDAPDARDNGQASMSAGDTILLGVHVTDEAHADLARDTLRDEHALEIEMRNAAWTWPTHEDTGTREHSALDELGLKGLADAVKRQWATTTEQVRASSSAPASSDTRRSSEAGHPGNEAEATVLTAASAPGAGAVMGSHVDVPGAPQATRASKDAAPQIPDEFLEYEDDTPAHHRTLH